MVPADDDHKDTPEVDSSASTKERKSGRLKPMPDCLMKWWIPILLALILLAAGCFLASIWRMPLEPFSWGSINPFWPPSWPFNYHWPSKDAMALCATIAGAGFAFSAWQQRSHDNAVRDDDKLDRERAAAQARAEREEQRGLEETRRLEQIERDEYWKRREQIYQLLGSENPGLRLGAVALLAELADKAAQSEQLNKTEQQQLQRHIIDTLCLQLRHEGIDRNGEGTISERAQIQEAIFETILTRIELPGDESPYADWSRESINITSCVVHTPIYITNLTTHATIDLSQSTFLGKFELNNANIPTLLWDRAYFINELITQNDSVIGIKSLPQVAPYSRYIKTTFVHNLETFIITLMSYKNYTTEPEITLWDCKFISKSTNSSTPIKIHTIHDESNDQKTAAQNLRIYQCKLADIIIDATYINSQISIVENSIIGHLEIDLTEIANQDGVIERTPHTSDRILIRNNVIQPSDNFDPIGITNYTDTEITNLISLRDNRIFRPNNFSTPHILVCETLTENPNPFKFSERTREGQIIHTWQTGGGHEDLDLFSDSIFIASPTDIMLD